MSRTAKIYLAIGTLCCIFFYFQSLSPLALDDFTFKNQVRDPAGILAQAVTQYYRWDGRITGYLLNLSILLLPRVVADVLLSLTPLALILVMNMHALGADWKERLSWKHLGGAFCLLWLSVPDFGQVFFWKTGTPYTIIVLLYLLLLWPYRVMAERGLRSSGVFYAILPLAAFCGLADFHNTVAVALLTLALSGYETVRSRRLHLAPYLTPVVLLACFVIIYTAPGNALRIQDSVPEFLETSRWTHALMHLSRQGSVQSYYLWEYLLAVVACIGLWRCRFCAAAETVETSTAPEFTPEQGVRIHVPAEYLPLCVAAVFFLLAQAVQLVFMFAPPAEPRVFTSSVIFMIIAVLALARHAADRIARGGGRTVLWRVFWIPAGCVCLGSLVMAGIMYYDTGRYVRDCERLITAAQPGGHVQVPACPYLSGRFVFYGRNFGVQEEDCWGNRQMALYYHIGSIRLEPQAFALVADPLPGGGWFHGGARDSVLAFTYAPSAANAGMPFVFAYAPVPVDLAHQYGYALAERYLRGTPWFPDFIRAVYGRFGADVRLVGSTVTGTAKLPRLEHASRLYVMHYDPRSAEITALIPLEITRYE